LAYGFDKGVYSISGVTGEVWFAGGRNHSRLFRSLTVEALDVAVVEEMVEITADAYDAYEYQNSEAYDGAPSDAM
jgi:hypothetical protein